jgi:phosphohistidine phosphatase SixA
VKDGTSPQDETIRLLICRHAKANRQDAGLRDFDRPLNQRGERDAPEMARRLAQRGVRSDLIMTSPAERALATALHYARQFGGRIGSILTLHERVPEGYRNVYIRMYGIPRDKLDALKTALRKDFILLHAMDHENNIRELYQDSLLS